MGLRSYSHSLHAQMRRWLIPKVQHAQETYADTLLEAIPPGSSWLDVGCGHRILRRKTLPTERALVGRCATVVGIDRDLAALPQHQTIKRRVGGSIAELPFQDQTFEVVTANMVVEHLQEPEREFAEIARVLRRGGLFILHTPNAWGYYVLASRFTPSWMKPKMVYLINGRREADVFPTFYRANTRRRIRRLAASAGFEVVKADSVVSTGVAVLALCPPLCLLQLTWIRLLLLRPLAPFRTSFICVLRKVCALLLCLGALPVSQLCEGIL